MLNELRLITSPRKKGVLPVPAAVLLDALAVAAAPPRDHGGADDRASDEEQCPDALRRADARAHAGPHGAAAPRRLLSRFLRGAKIVSAPSAAHFHDSDGGS